jgi:hypothetical protein
MMFKNKQFWRITTMNIEKLEYAGLYEIPDS